MILTVDIGNTNIHNGIFDKGLPKKVFRFLTYADDLRSLYRTRLSFYSRKIEYIICVSVVPESLRKTENILRNITGKKVLVVGRDVNSGVKNLYKDPKQVGQDRLVNARAAYDIHGGASIIVDFGTAITIDVVNRHKEYLGGVIAPGVEISLDALSKRAVLLPKVHIKKPGSILGKETRQSMINGAVYGFSSLCDGIVQKLKKRYCKKARVIATGGLASLIAPYCRTVDKVDSELTLKGLELIGAGYHV